MRSPADMDILQVDISNKCFLSCTHCTRAIGHQPKKWEMDLATFKRAILSLEGWNKPNRVVGIIAGEPTLNSNFREIALAFADMWGGPLTKNGRKPIRDFNAFMQERLFDRSNGRGLWTSLGPGFYKHMELCLDVFSHFNCNTHESGGKHQAMFLHRDDYQAQTGMSDDEWEENTRNCFVQNMWSGTTNDKGSYPCEVMAVIDRLYFDGSHAWPTEHGWWQRKPEDFGNMLDLCNFCSLAQPGPSRVDSEERDIISEKNRVQLQMIGSPAVRRGHFDLYDASIHKEQREVTTKDNYVPESGQRVSPDNASVRPRSVSCVVVCVGCADQLAKTLPHNLPLVDRMVVVATSEDTETHAVVKSITDEKLIVVYSERCYDDGHAFNKGRMINDGLARIENPDWIVLTDADVFLNARLPEFVKTHGLNPGVLFGAIRLEATSDPRIIDEPMSVDAECNGYFQLFNKRASSLEDRAWPKIMSEAFCSAGGIDSWLMQQFDTGKRVVLHELSVRHIPHGSFGDRWNGKIKARQGRAHWVQRGMLTPRGIIRVPQEYKFPNQCRMLLTDTLFGEQAEIVYRHGEPLPSEVVSIGDTGMTFLGSFIGGNHIHVAIWE